ncbi:hypothetical protein Srufu_064930 [Streptomyces libani subsp. rufus]|nr:hypothetical protein Srufu_064930 [Streptomyces libani subsp. rufus]
MCSDVMGPLGETVRVDALTVRAAGDPGQGATVARQWTIHCAFKGLCGDSLRRCRGGLGGAPGPAGGCPREVSIN